MAFQGPYRTVFGGNTAAIAIGATTFGGDVVNSGTISAYSRGIGLGFAPNAPKVKAAPIPPILHSFIDNVVLIIIADILLFLPTVLRLSGPATSPTGTVFAGRIANTGTVFAGGITNAGTVTAACRGLGLGFVPLESRATGGNPFSGNIVNSGTITAKNGIGSSGENVRFLSSASGGLTISQGQAFPRHGIDLLDIAFGAQTTLAYSANAAGTGGTLTVSDGRHAASIALLGTYMADSFVATADGHGGTLVTQAQLQQPLLAHPHAG